MDFSGVTGKMQWLLPPSILNLGRKLSFEHIQAVAHDSLYKLQRAAIPYAAIAANNSLVVSGVIVSLISKATAENHDEDFEFLKAAICMIECIAVHCPFKEDGIPKFVLGDNALGIPPGCEHLIPGCQNNCTSTYKFDFDPSHGEMM